MLFVRVPDIFAHAQGQKLRDEQLFPSLLLLQEMTDFTQ